MASRQEEKARRRAEREAAEQATSSAHARTRRLQLAGVALAAIAAIVVAVVVVAGGGGSGGGGSADAPAPKATDGASIPAVDNRNLITAAKDAGCVLRSPTIEGSTHVLTAVTYKTNPPTSGNHNPDPALDGIYDPGNSPAPEHFVHALEHGRVEIQYRPGTSAHRIAQLKTLASEALYDKDAYKVLLFENNTKMPYAVAATAWGQMITCKTFNPRIFDAIRAFRLKYVDKGPEKGIPPNN